MEAWVGNVGGTIRFVTDGDFWFHMARIVRKDLFDCGHVQGAR
jgi:hypothetical protein